MDLDRNGIRCAQNSKFEFDPPTDRTIIDTAQRSQQFGNASKQFSHASNSKASQLVPTRLTKHFEPDPLIDKLIDFEYAPRWAAIHPAQTEIPIAFETAVKHVTKCAEDVIAAVENSDSVFQQIEFPVSSAASCAICKSI